MSESPQGSANPKAGKRSPLVIIAVLAAVVVLGCAAVYAWGYFGAKGAVDAVKQATVAGANRPTTASISIDAATPDQFYSDTYFTDEQRVDWAWNKINQPSHEAGYEGMTLLQAAHKKLADSVNNKPQYGNVEFLHELVAPSEGMSGDQVLAYISTLSYLAATADLPDSDRAKILAASSDNSSPNLRSAIAAAEQRDIKHMSGTSEVLVADNLNKKLESPVFRHYKPGNGYDPAGIPSKVMTVTETSSGKSNFSQMIVHFTSGKPTVVDDYAVDIPSKLIDNPQDIPYEPR